MLNLKAHIFFDREKVIRSMRAATRRALSKAGAYVRTTARQSMRQRRGPSRPGQPPSVHEGSLKRLLFFAWDAQAQSVVIGPVGFKNSRVPEILEYGGTVTVQRRRAGGKKKYTRRVVIKARPYMGPALRAKLQQIPKQFHNAISAGHEGGAEPFRTFRARGA